MNYVVLKRPMQTQTFCWGKVKWLFLRASDMALNVLGKYTYYVSWDLKPHLHDSEEFCTFKDDSLTFGTLN